MSQYGYSDPEVSDFGREVFVEYHKGVQTVSISMELGSSPLIELFEPPRPGETAEPWTERDGVSRVRRVLAIHAQSPVPADDEELVDRLASMFSALEAQEAEFLTASG